MPRLYHSPSSILTARNGDEGCDYAWALRYIAGVRDVEVDYADIESGKIVVLPRDVPVPKGSRVFCTPRQKSTALGKAMHKVGEDRYNGVPVNWGTFPAKVFASGSHLLPDPPDCSRIETEVSIGFEPSGATEDYAPKTCLTIHGVKFAGNRDLLLEPGPSERARLGLPRLPGGLLQADYKSSSSIVLYAKSRKQLPLDLQASVYTVDLCRRFLLNRIASRWVYFETKSVRRAMPVDFEIDIGQALETIAGYVETANRVDQIMRLEDAEKNPRHCGAYAGCPHHISAGGTCNARKSLGALVQLEGKKKSNMALSPEQMAKFNALKKKTPAEVVAAEAPEDTTETAAVETPPAVEAPAPRTRKPRTTKAPEPATVQAIADAVVSEALAEKFPQVDENGEVVYPDESESRTSRILRLAQNLASAQAEVDRLLAEMCQACK